ncbi:MAG: disulfide bond formation protein B [Lysobacteraceae bacterium]
MSANPMTWSFRARFGAGFAACAGLMGYALFAQHVQGLEPCPLCVFQRVAMIALGLVFLLGFLHGPRGAVGRWIYAVLAVVAAGVGVGVAGRHVWLQSLPPDEVPACNLMSLDYMREAFPMREVVSRVLSGSGECAEIDWTFLGLSMPGWVLVWFVLLAAWAAWAGLSRR